jgi:acetyl-CoA carboxylase carboxyltransferase component
MLKRVLIKQNYDRKTPVIPSSDDPERCEESLVEILPDSTKKVHDPRRVISLNVDHGEFFGVKSGFSRNMIIGFARMNGKSVGIVANNPLFLASAIDCDATDMAARFIRTCDCFNIPLISLVDVPGYLPRVKEEYKYKGIIRDGAKMLYA